MKYRKKRIVVDAFLWTGDINQTEDPEWITAALKDGRVSIEKNPLRLLIKTLEGIMTAYPKYYIIKGVRGELYPCKPEIFEETYEPEE